jgi:phosphotriesterase-related protein
MSVNGPIESDALGMVLMHEHIFINSMREERSTGLLNDYGLMRQELSAFKEVGGRTIVELTTASLTSGACPDPTGRYGRCPASGYAENGTRAVNHVLEIARLAQELDLNVILGAGDYRDPFIDRELFDRVGTQTLTRQIVSELRTGIAGTDIRAGLIGEIGADKWFVSTVEERLFRAAARAQSETGVAITTHAARWPVGIEQLDILADEGADIRRVIIGHCDTVNLPDYHRDLAQRGAYVQFDTIRGNSEYDTRLRVGFVMNLVKAGFISQILLSHDTCSRTHLRILGGGGYTYIPIGFAAALEAAGLTRDDIDQLLIDNPRRILCWA